MWQFKKKKNSFFPCHTCFLGTSEVQTSCTYILIPRLQIFLLVCLIPIQTSFTDLLLWDNVACLSKITLAFGVMQEWGKKIPFQHSISCPCNNFQSSTRKKTLCLKLSKMSLRFKRWRKFEGISWVKLYFEHLKCVSSSRHITCFSSLKSGLVSRTDCAMHWLRKLKSSTWVQRCGFYWSYPWQLPIIYLHFL